MSRRNTKSPSRKCTSKQKCRRPWQERASTKRQKKRIAADLRIRSLDGRPIVNHEPNAMANRLSIDLGGRFAGTDYVLCLLDGPLHDVYQRRRGNMVNLQPTAYDSVLHLFRQLFPVQMNRETRSEFPAISILGG